MRGLLLSWLIAGWIVLASSAPIGAQPAPPPAPTEKAVEPPKAPETKKADRDGAVAVSYTLAAIGVVIVMVLVCMPARRE